MAIKEIFTFISSDYQRYKGSLGGVKMLSHICYSVLIIVLTTAFGCDLLHRKTLYFLWRYGCTGGFPKSMAYRFPAGVR